MITRETHTIIDPVVGDYLIIECNEELIEARDLLHEAIQAIGNSELTEPIGELANTLNAWFEKGKPIVINFDRSKQIKAHINIAIAELSRLTKRLKALHDDFPTGHAILNASLALVQLEPQTVLYNLVDRDRPIISYGHAHLTHLPLSIPTAELGYNRLDSTNGKAFLNAVLRDIERRTDLKLRSMETIGFLSNCAVFSCEFKTPDSDPDLETAERDEHGDFLIDEYSPSPDRPSLEESLENAWLNKLTPGLRDRVMQDKELMQNFLCAQYKSINVQHKQSTNQTVAQFVLEFWQNESQGGEISIHDEMSLYDLALTFAGELVNLENLPVEPGVLLNFFSFRDGSTLVEDTHDRAHTYESNADLWAEDAAWRRG